MNPLARLANRLDALPWPLTYLAGFAFFVVYWGVLGAVAVMSN